jgi:uncharacterized membrane protein
MKVFGDSLDKSDKIWETISLLLLITNILIIVFSLPKLPDIIPIHFNLAGEANGWGSKNTLWIMFAITIPMYALLTFISGKPELYRSRMSENNMEEQLRLTSKMTRIMKTVVLLIFVMVTVFMVQTAQGKWQEQIVWTLPIILTLIFAPTCYYLLNLAKLR